MREIQIAPATAINSATIALTINVDRAALYRSFVSRSACFIVSC